MSENSVKKQTINDTDILFGIPDTGVSVTWDFNSGFGSKDKDVKGTHLRPVTPKPTKYSSTSRIYRRRCLSNPIKIPDIGDDAFAEQMLSLVSVNRKNILKNSNSPGVSPNGRSPRELRSTSKPSPLRDDNFQFLLNDSIDNDDMIRCSQITEAALKEEEMSSPKLPKKVGRLGSAKKLALGKNVSSPLSRKRLLNAIASSQSGSPRPSTSAEPTASLTKIDFDSDSVKCTDRSNNNVDFGTSEDDDVLLNCMNASSKTEQPSLPKKSPRLSLSKKPQFSIPGVTPLAPKKVLVEGATHSGGAKKEGIMGNPEIKSKPVEAVKAADDLVDDDMDFDLSPHLLKLLDGGLDGSKGQDTPKVEPCPTKKTVTSQPNRTTTPLSVPKVTSKAVESFVPKQGTSSVAPQKSSLLSLNQAARTKESVPPSNYLTRHSSAPVPSRPSQPLRPIPKQNTPLVPNVGTAPVKRCTPEEIERKRQEALKKLKRSQTK